MCRFRRESGTYASRARPQRKAGPCGPPAADDTLAVWCIFAVVYPLIGAEVAAVDAQPSRDARRLLVVEDDERLRTLLETSLSPVGWRTIGACNGAEAMARLSEVAPLVALVDLGLPDISGVELIRRIAAASPDLPIVVLTVCTEEARILEAFRAGARGYLFKEDLGRDLVPALDEALAGGAPMSRPVARLVLQQLRATEATDRPAAPHLPALTERERQVVEQLARGLSYEHVGMVLGISTNTVRSYIRAIYEKLCVCSRTEAVVVALRLGLVASS